MQREPRFSDIDWYCDNCESLLNTQKNFDDHKYVWKCKNCGYKNSISWDSIRSDDSVVMQFLLHTLGFLSYVSLWTIIMLGIAIWGFHVDVNKYFTILLVFIGIYIFALVLDVLIEFNYRSHIKFNIKNLIKIIFRNILEELMVPFQAIKEFISQSLSFITHKIPIKRKYRWHLNKGLFVYSIGHLFIFITEIVIFSVIIEYGINDWAKVISSIYESINNLLIHQI